MHDNTFALEMTKEITVALLSESKLLPNADAGKLVAEFMEEVFLKIKSLETY